MSPYPIPLLHCRERQPGQHILSPPIRADWEASLLLKKAEGDEETYPVLLCLLAHRTIPNRFPCTFVVTFLGAFGYLI